MPGPDRRRRTCASRGRPPTPCARGCASMDLDVDFAERAGDVPLPMLRMLDLARALARDPQLLLLDEITAALPSDLAERVFTVMRDWRERGRSVLFITHRLAEVIATCDRATVLRDGADVGTLVPQEGGEERDRRVHARARGGAGGGGGDPRSTRQATDAARDAGRARRSRSRPRRRAASRTSRFTLRARRDPRRRRARGPGPGRAVRRALRAALARTAAQIVVRGQAAAGRATRTTRSAPGSCSSRPTACTRCCRSARSPRTSRRRATTASAAGGRSTCATSGGACARRSRRCRSTRARSARCAASRAATSRRSRSRAGSPPASARCSASTRRAASTSARSARSTRCCARSPTTARAILFFSSELAEFPLVCDRVITLFGGRVDRRAAGRGGRRGLAAARDARARHRRGAGRVTPTTADVEVERRRIDVRRLARRHGWTVGVLRCSSSAMVALLALGDDPAVGPVRRRSRSRSTRCRSRSRRWARRS